MPWKSRNYFFWEASEAFEQIKSFKLKPFCWYLRNKDKSDIIRERDMYKPKVTEVLSQVRVSYPKEEWSGSSIQLVGAETDSITQNNFWHLYTPPPAPPKNVIIDKMLHFVLEETIIRILIKNKKYILKMQ